MLNPGQKILSFDCRLKRPIKTIHLIPGRGQELRQGDGAEDEQAAVEPEQHAQGGPTDEQAESPEYSQVSACPFWERAISLQSADFEPLEDKCQILTFTNQV